MSMWHPDQKIVASCLLQILDELVNFWAELTELGVASHQPCLLQGQSFGNWQIELLQVPFP